MVIELEKNANYYDMTLSSIFMLGAASLMFTLSAVGFNVVEVITAVGGLIGAIGGSIAFVISARTKAKEAVNEEKIKSLRKALEVEQKTIERLFDEMKRDRTRIDELEKDLREERILNEKYRGEIMEKEIKIINLEKRILGDK